MRAAPAVRGRRPDTAPTTTSGTCSRCGITRPRIRGGRTGTLCMDCFQVDRQFGKYPDRLR